jgi:hypothetical protein
MFLSVGGSFAYLERNARCTVTTSMSLHTLASPSGRNVNYDENNLVGNCFFIFLLSVQVS